MPRRRAILALSGAGALAALTRAALVAAVAWWRGGRTRWWLFAAGVLGGCALLMKQGGFDGLVAAAALAVAVPASRGERVRAGAAVAAGAAIPLGAALLHAVSVGL